MLFTRHIVLMLIVLAALFVTSCGSSNPGSEIVIPQPHMTHPAAPPTDAPQGERSREPVQTAKGSGGIAAPPLKTVNSYSPIKRNRKRPNILIFISDDQRDNTMRPMPSVRKIMGKGGTYYTNAFVTSPLCCPSRASIFSGRLAHNTLVTSNLWPRVQRYNQAKTLQKTLGDKGYYTALIGKYLNHYHTGDAVPYWNQSELDWNSDVTSNAQMLKETQAFIKERAHSSRPWFLVVAAHFPHAPYDPTPKYSRARVGPIELNPAITESPKARAADLAGKPKYVRWWARQYASGKAPRGSEEAPAQPPRVQARAQLRMQMSLDDLFAGIYGSLRHHHQADHTMTFYLSDNGVFWGDHGLYSKFFPYINSIRVPMYLRWPGHIPAGKIVQRMVANIDIAATIYHVTGIHAPYRVDGQTLMMNNPRVFMLTELGRTHKRPPWGSLLGEGWHYIQTYPHRQLRGRPSFKELYNTGTDPNEIHNLLRSRNPRVSRAARRISNTLAPVLRRALNCHGHQCEVIMHTPVGLPDQWLRKYRPYLRR